MASAGLYDEDLVAKVRNTENTSDSVSTTLHTDERVIARVTDGIYRQPGSALRELISNAYDADATRVIIKTDPPRFGRISIEDNGHGMSLETVAHLIHHIGGSLKRNEDGAEFGITKNDNPLLSPRGRRLIGKIGIGLFSVSQLTQAFQIITKKKGESFRTIATVVLKQYSEDGSSANQDKENKFESGKVEIWRERAEDKDTHGTTIILDRIRPQARDTLRSREIWSAIEEAENSQEDGEKQNIYPPNFHIGRVDPGSGDLLKELHGNKLDSLPWDRFDPPEQAFKKLVDAVWSEAAQSNPHPRLEHIFDYYLRMVWQLALAIPTSYVDGNLFDLDLYDSADVFKLSNTLRGGTAERLHLKQGQTIRTVVDMQEPQGPRLPFDVFFDDLKLMRPIKFRNLPVTKNKLTKPIVFVGKCRQEFSNVQRELSGGPLAFEAYIFWTPKIAPTEHRGSLIRIHGSSGTLFDPTFMRYQVSEQTRLSQITCEIFVSEGLDSALNIDRESFNYAHPHSVYITKWLHSALRQMATTHKKLGSGVREQARNIARDVFAGEIQKAVQEVWKQENFNMGSEVPEVEFTETGMKEVSGADAYVFSRFIVMPGPEKAGPKNSRAIQAAEDKLKAIVQVLAAFGVLEAIPKPAQEKMLRAIYKILDTSES